MNKQKTRKILCITAHLQTQHINYIKHLSKLLSIEIKIYLTCSKQHYLHIYSRHIRERALYFIPDHISINYVDIPNEIRNLGIREKGFAVTEYLKSINFNWNFNPDIVLYSQKTGVNSSLRKLFDNSPKMIMYAEWFVPSDLAQRKEWPLTEYKKPYSDIWKKKSEYDAKNVDAIIVPSIYAKNFWPKNYHDNIYVNFEGVDIDYLSSTRIDILSKFGERIKKTLRGKKLVGFISRSIESTRGFDLWMKAYVELRKERHDLHFIVLGKDKAIQSGGGGASNYGIKNFKSWTLNQLELTENNLDDITWIESLPFFDYLSLLKNLDLVIYPTIGMFANWSFFHAMHMGVPIIASNSSYFPEVIEDGENGLLVDPYSIDEIVYKSLLILNDNNYANNIIKNARLTIQNNFSTINSNIKFEQLIDELFDLQHENNNSSSITDNISCNNDTYNFDSTIKSEIGFYIVLDDSEITNINHLVHLLNSIKDEFNINIYIGLRCSNKVYFDSQINNNSSNVVVKYFPKNRISTTIINVLIQSNLSKINVIISSNIKVKNLYNFIDELKNISSTNKNFIAGIDIENNSKITLESFIFVISHNTFNKLGYLNEKLQITDSIIEYSKYAHRDDIANINLNTVNLKESSAEHQSLYFQSFLELLSMKYNPVRNIHHGYTIIYEKYFNKTRLNIKKILYIGLHRHIESIKMFLDYFPNAYIYGCSSMGKNIFVTERTSTVIADQSDRKELEKLIKETGSDFDIIIDDGGHTMRQTQTSLGFLFSKLIKGGIYTIESMHVCPETNGVYAAAKNKNRWIEGNEISTLALVKLLANKKAGNIINSFCTFDELNHLITQYVFCNIEMGNKSEIIFIGKENDEDKLVRHANMDSTAIT